MTPPASTTTSPTALRRSRVPGKRRNSRRSEARSCPAGASQSLALQGHSGDRYRKGHPFARYTTPLGNPRELVVDEAAGGSLLVIDRDGVSLCDRRLIAHIAADEPSENVAIVCDQYLADESGRFCRLVEPDDLLTAPFAAPTREDIARSHGHRTDRLLDRPAVELDAIEVLGRVYRLAVLSLPKSRGRQLRWGRHAAHDTGAVWEPVSLREVVGALQSYEPPLTLTATALALHADCDDVSLLRLRSEYERMCASPVVLNRRLREAVLQATRARRLTFSEIARRCGKVKFDRCGRRYGETSWLARRVGLMPEGGQQAGTPWVHSEVLALIARQGLGMSPREVEL